MRCPAWQIVAFMPILFLALCCPAVPAGSEEPKALVLAEAGQAWAVIVVARDAPGEVRRGASELQQYVEQISDVRLAMIAPDNVASHREKVRIHVGVNASIPGPLPDLARCEKDGAWIRAISGRDLLIAGKTPYGTEFGVYGFLQRFCGVRWFLPGPEGTHVPKAPSLRIPLPIDRLDNPVFISRSYSAPTFRDRLDYPCPQAQLMDLAWYRHNRMRKHFWCHHNLGHIIVPSKYGTEHPEFFPEIGGERRVPVSDRPVGFQPCMTNKSVIRLCAEAAAEHFTTTPDALSFSIGINDHGGFCECETCRTVNGPPRLNSRGLPDFSRLLFSFGNHVAASLPERFRDRYVGLLAYAQARDLPRDMDIHPNLLVGRVTAFVSYFNPADRADMAMTRRMAEKCNMFGVYDYWYGRGYAVPNFGIGLLEDYLDFLNGLGVKSWNSEVYQNWTMDGIKYYVLSRKLWDPSLRVSDLLNDFCTRMFGDGAPEMMRFYDLCRERWETQTFATTKYHLCDSGKQALLFDQPTCEQLMALLKTARAKTANTGGQALLERFIGTFTYTRHWAELLDHSLFVADKGKVVLNAREEGPHREEDVIPETQFCRTIEDMAEYRGHVLAALRTLRAIGKARTAIRSDVLSLPRRGLGRLGGMFTTPVTCTAPLVLALQRTGRQTELDAFIDAAHSETPELTPQIRWLATHFPDLANEPELLLNGNFEEPAANRYDAKGWVHGNWGSKRTTANAFVVPQGTDGGNCYYMVGVKHAFTYGPTAAIKLAKPVPVEPGKWYVLQARVRSHRNDGLLPEPSLHIQFPGARPGAHKANLSPGMNWYDAVTLFQAPAKASEAIVRFLSTGQGQTWVDSMSLKRIPDAITPDSAETADALVVYPPLRASDGHPSPLTIDFTAPLPTGVHAITGKIDGGVLVADTGYTILSASWTFAHRHDLVLKVNASSPDGATLGILAFGNACAEGNRWVRIDKKIIGPFRRKL
ncbi:MAG: DUF4838 domain-containing protein, partial [Lentisphaerae bacterium]|nr:DUF4838 domain-containing protein [Lentisphaerota bacterium]